MNFQEQGYRGDYGFPGSQPNTVPTAGQQQVPRRPRKRNGRGRGSFSPGRLFLYFAALLIVGAGVWFGLKWYRAWSAAEKYSGVFLDNIYIDGIPMGGKTLQQGYDAVIASVTQRQNSWALDLVYNGHLYFTVNYETLGIHTDLVKVESLVRNAYALGHTGSVFDIESDIQALSEQPYSLYTTQTRMNTEYLDSMVLAPIADDMYLAPRDAYLASFDPDASDPFTISPEANGRRLDTSTVREQILTLAGEGTSGALQLVPETLYPKVTTADIRSQVTLLSTGVTPISSSSTDNRNNNIRLAFSRFNGLVVKSGESVSFNAVVGERNKANGFLDAVEYVYNLPVTGVGGGVCQASTTIYKAALCANLKVTKREPHSELVSYTVFGQDATVYWGGRKIDLVFVNNSLGNIYITAHVQKNGGHLECVVRIYGRSLGDGVYYTLDTQTVEEIPKPEIPEYVKDIKQLYVTYTDEEFLDRAGHDGFINETYLQRWENGVLVESTLVSRDPYPAVADRYYVGVKVPEITDE